MKKVNFKEVEIKNFLSIGNSPVKLEFKPGLHIITGINRDKIDRRNGIGKTSVIESIYFAIFGSTMRELKKELWPHRVTVNSQRLDDITTVEVWLGKRLGTFKGRWNVVYQHNRTDFYFRLGEDATLFALRWA